MSRPEASTSGGCQIMACRNRWSFGRPHSPHNAGPTKVAATRSSGSLRIRGAGGHRLDTATDGEAVNKLPQDWGAGEPVLSPQDWGPRGPTGRRWPAVLSQGAQEES